jgi:hypothetical protein
MTRIVSEVENDFRIETDHKKGPLFEVKSGSGERWLVGVRISGMYQIDLDRLDHADVELALRAWLLDRIRSADGDVGGGDSPIWVDLGWNEDEELRPWINPDKSCEWQADTGRDLYCTAVSIKDTGENRLIDGLVAAPASREICGQCSIPDATTLCSAFSHPKTIAPRGTGRTFAGALCRVGKNGAQEDPASCRAGGHDCWHVEIEPEPISSVPISGTALLEAFDFLDAVWRARHGRNARLLQVRAVSGIGELALDCSTRQEFGQRVIKLADLLDRIDVPDEMLGSPGDDELPSGSMDRLGLWANQNLVGELGESAAAAILSLRSARQLRVPFAHDKPEELPKRLGRLGIPFPPDWAEAWVQVRRFTIDALTAFRNSVDD